MNVMSDETIDDNKVILTNARDLADYGNQPCRFGHRPPTLVKTRRREDPLTHF